MQAAEERQQAGPLLGMRNIGRRSPQQTVVGAGAAVLFGTDPLEHRPDRRTESVPGQDLQ